MYHEHINYLNHDTYGVGYSPLCISIIILHNFFSSHPMLSLNLGMPSICLMIIVPQLCLGHPWSSQLTWTRACTAGDRWGRSWACPGRSPSALRSHLRPPILRSCARGGCRCGRTTTARRPRTCSTRAHLCLYQEGGWSLIRNDLTQIGFTRDLDRFAFPKIMGFMDQDSDRILIFNSQHNAQIDQYV